MTRNRLTTLLAGAGVVAFAAIAVSACGSGGGGGATAATAPPKTADGVTATVGVSNSSLGKILVDSQNRTLYLFQKDSGGKSTCFGACASAWPPLRASGKPTGASGTNDQTIGTIKRSDGKPQVTYNGHPVYLYQGDSKAGDVNGQGLTAFGGSWFAVSPAGNPVSGQASSPSTGNGY